MRRLFVSVAAFAAMLAPAGNAKPLLTNSEHTYASVCLSAEDTPERLIEICQQALALDGASDAQVLDMQDTLGWAYFNLGDEDTSREIFEGIREAMPNSAPAARGLGWIAHWEGDFAAAAMWFEAAMSEKPDHTALAGLASSLYRDGVISLEEAVTRMDAALAIEPEYGWTLREKGWLYAESGHVDPAIEAFERALDIDPNDANALYGMAYSLGEGSRWREALGYVNRSLQEDPESIIAVSRRSLILLNLGRATQALRDGERVVEAWPDDSDGYVRVARAQVALGKTGDAFVTLAEAKDRLGYDSYLNYWISDLLYEDGQYQAAIAPLKAVFENGDAGYFEHSLMSRIHLSLGDGEQARDTIDAAKAAFADEPWLLFYDSIQLIREAQYDAAEAGFDRAVELGLPQEELTFFLEELVGAARYVQAVKMRVKYRDLAAMDQDG